MKKIVSFLYYDSLSGSWQQATPEHLASLNDPGLLVVPVYEDGTQGEQKTWRIWDLSRQQEMIQSELDYIKEAKTRLHIPKEFSEELQHFPEATIKEKETIKEKKMRELKHLEMLPPEVRSVDYLLRHSNLPFLLDEMTSLVKSASTLITFIIILNATALVLGLLVLLASMGR